MAITWLDPKGPLKGATFEVGDIILGVENQEVDSFETFVNLISSLKPNQRITLLALDHRTGNTGNVQVVVR